MSDSSACLQANGEPHSAVTDQSNDSRILASWAALFGNSGFEIGEIREPTVPNSGRPLSVLFVASAKAKS